MVPRRRDAFFEDARENWKGTPQLQRRSADAPVSNVSRRREKLFRLARRLVKVDRCRNGRKRDKADWRGRLKMILRRRANSKAVSTRIAAANSAFWRCCLPWAPNTMARSAGRTSPPDYATSSPGPATTAKSAPMHVPRSHARKAELAEVVAGSRRKYPGGSAGRLEPGRRSSALMQRMNIAHEERLRKWLANERQFAEHRDEVRHEAKLVAVIAE